MNRKQRLKKPPPAGWIPIVGEHVIIPVVKDTLAANVMSGTIRFIAPPFLKVLVRCGRYQARVFNFRIDEVRPFKRT